MKRVYYVNSMSCANCKKILSNALSSFSGIKSVSVSLRRKEIAVDADFNIITDTEIIAAIRSHMHMAKRK